MTKYVLVDADQLAAIVAKAPKVLKAKLTKLQGSAKGVNPKAIELLALLNDFMENME